MVVMDKSFNLNLSFAGGQWNSVSDACLWLEDEG